MEGGAYYTIPKGRGYTYVCGNNIYRQVKNWARRIHFGGTSRTAFSSPAFSAPPYRHTGEAMCGAMHRRQRYNSFVCHTRLRRFNTSRALYSWRWLTASAGSCLVCCTYSAVPNGSGKSLRLLRISLPNIDWFSKFFHWHILPKIRSKAGFPANATNARNVTELTQGTEGT